MQPIQRGPYQVISTRDVYHNRWIRVREDKVIHPGGQEGVFGVVEMKAGSSVLALTENDEVYLVSEYKYGIGRDSVELMSGGLEEAETPIEAAKRELKEELGLEATEWIELGVVDPFTTIIHSPNYLFLALGVKEGSNSPDEGEILKLMKVPLPRAIEMVMNSMITHSASCVLILKAAKYLQERKK